jgi:hypothetical protein
MLAEPPNNNDVSVEQGAATYLQVGGKTRPACVRRRVGRQSVAKAIQTLARYRDPPHELSREVIEQAIRTQGFQLWRMSKKD